MAQSNGVVMVQDNESIDKNKKYTVWNWKLRKLNCYYQETLKLLKLKYCLHFYRYTKWLLTSMDERYLFIVDMMSFIRFMKRYVVHIPSISAIFKLTFSLYYKNFNIFF